MKQIILGLALGLSVLVSACGVPTPGALIAMSRIDPRTTDFDEVHIAVRTPLSLRLAPAGLTLHIQGFDGEGAVIRDVKVPVRGQARGSIALDLKRLEKAGTRLTLLKLAPQEAAQVEALRNEMFAAKARGEKGGFSLGFNLEQVCYTGSRPQEIPYSIFARTLETQRFFQVVGNQDLIRDAKKAGENIHSYLAPCR